MQKLLITNVVYGDIYAPIFLNQHLKSFLDESNIPAFKDRVQYIIYADDETEPMISKHPNLIKLRSLCDVKIAKFEWPSNTANKYASRYSIQILALRDSVREALERGGQVQRSCRQAASRESCSRTASAASYASRDCLQHQQVAELQNFSESLLTRNREGQIGTVAHAVHSSSNSGIPGSKRHEVLE